MTDKKSALPPAGDLHDPYKAAKEYLAKKVAALAAKEAELDIRERNLVQQKALLMEMAGEAEKVLDAELTNRVGRLAQIPEAPDSLKARVNRVDEKTFQLLCSTRSAGK